MLNLSYLSGEPARRLGHEEDTEKQDDGRDHLQRPWDPESLSAVEVATSEGHVVHDEDTPGDGPLLSTNNTTSLGRRGKFGNIDGNLS